MSQRWPGQERARSESEQPLLRSDVRVRAQGHLRSLHRVCCGLDLGPVRPRIPREAALVGPILVQKYFPLLTLGPPKVRSRAARNRVTPKIKCESLESHRSSVLDVIVYLRICHAVLSASLGVGGCVLLSPSLLPGGQRR